MTLADGAPRDRCYSIHADGARRGSLRMVAGDLALADGLRRRMCYEALEARSSPCPGCPVFTEGHESTTGVLETDTSGDYRLVSYAVRGRDNLIVTLRHISEEMLASIERSKLARVANRARLSRQERRVLELVVTGRATEHIAETLGISARTVRFHQTNAFAKLGADSRADLLRLLF